MRLRRIDSAAWSRGQAVRRLGRRPDLYALLVLGRTFLLGFLNDGPMFHLAEAVAGLGG